MLYQNVVTALLAFMVTSAIAAPAMRISADDLAARDLGVREPSAGQFPDEDMVPVEPGKLVPRVEKTRSGGGGGPACPIRSKQPPPVGGKESSKTPKGKKIPKKAS